MENRIQMVSPCTRNYNIFEIFDGARLLCIDFVMPVCLQRAYEVVRMDSSSENSAALEDVVPHHDDAGSNQLCNHVINPCDVDEYPHE